MNFIQKYFFHFLLAVGILLFVYTFFKSEIYWGGSRREHYFKYYIFFSLVIIFSIITFFLNQILKNYIIITLISVIFGIYAFEFYLIFNSKQVIKKKIKSLEIAKIDYKKKTGKNFDIRDKYEVYAELKKKNIDISMNIPPSLHLDKDLSILPLAGISNSETIYCNENGYYSFYESDRFGFRNPDQEWDSDTIEYVLIGDSYTQGACVNEPNDFGSILRNLSKKSVLNLGYSSNGPLLEYAILREYLSPKVKKVIWIYFEGNDLNDLKREKRSKILTSYLKNQEFTQNLKSKQTVIDGFLRNNIENLIKNKIKTKNNQNKRFKILEFIILENFRETFLKTKTPILDFKKILEQTKNLTLKNRSELYFVYLPSYKRYKNKYFKNKNYNNVKKIVNDLDIKFIDVYKEIIQKEKNPLKLYPFGLSYHFNEYGYNEVGKLIYKSTIN